MHPSRIVVLAASLALLAASFAQAQHKPPDPVDTQPLKTIFLEAEKLVQQIPARPALLGGSLATQAPEHKAPAGGHDHHMAWRGAGGCIAFFYAPPEAKDVRIQWDGPDCKGGLVQGQGRLLIQRRDNNQQIVLGVLQGDFEDGLLEGEGQKTHYVFDVDARPTQEVWRFEGSFQHSVLQGEGVRTHHNALDKLPGVSVVMGQFREGQPRGAIQLVRLRPYPGVTAEFLELGFDAQGSAVKDQAIANGGAVRDGWWMLGGDATPWHVEVAQWGDQYPTAARLTRIPAAGIRSFASCDQWRMDKGVLQCPKGEAWHERAFSAISVRGGAFSLPLAPAGNTVPFRVTPEVQLFASVGGPEPRSDSGTLTCNDVVSLCEGRMKMPLQGLSELYLEGQAQWLQGVVQWQRVGFYPMPKDIAAPYFHGMSIEDMEAKRLNTDRLGRNDAWAECRRGLDPAMRCSEGTVVVEDGGKFTGAWRLHGVAVRLQDGVPYWLATGDHGPVPEGAGRLQFKNGPWIDVRYVDGRVASVGACGGAASVTLRCTLGADGIRVTGTGVDDTWPAGEAFLREPESELQPPEAYAAERPRPVLPGDLSRLGEFLPRR